jgi:tetratricopeptide (TPR) repeat protein/DNA-binding CsgD family transcriptional regulator
MGKKLMINILFVIILGISAMPQNTNFSKYRLELNNAHDSLQKVYLYHEIINEIKDSSPDDAIIFAKKAIQLANKVQSPKACGLTNELLGELWGMKNSIQPAINYYLISARKFEEINDYIKLSSIYGKLGLLYYENDFDTETTLEYYKKSLNYAVMANNDTLVGLSYNRIGGLFFNQKNFTEALYYFNEAYKIFIKVNSSHNIAISLNNIGDTYRRMGEFDKAMTYLEESLKKVNETNYLKLPGIIYENIGQIKSAQKNYEDAISFYNKSIDAYKKINNRSGMAEVLILIANIELLQNNIDESFSAYQESNSIATELNNPELLKDSHLGLSHIYEIKKQYAKSLDNLRKYAEFNDTLLTNQMNKRLVDLQSHFLRNISEKELQIKDSQIELLESENELESVKKNLLILGVIFLLAAFIVTWIILKKQIKKQRLINQKDNQIHEAKQDLLQLDLDNKANDLMTFALHIVQKNNLLRQLKKELSSLSSDKDIELTKRLKELSAHVQQNLHINQELEEFQHKVDNAYDDFFKKLDSKFPFLTRNERRLCVLLRLNLSTKEIASLNNTSIKAVEMGRYRLRKKCGIDNKQSIVEYMQKI